MQAIACQMFATANKMANAVSPKWRGASEPECERSEPEWRSVSEPEPLRKIPEGEMVLRDQEHVADDGDGDSEGG